MKKVLITMLLSLSIISTAWGANTTTAKLPQKNVVSTMMAGMNARGEFIALGMLEISNLGSGYIGIYIQTLAHEDVDKIKQRVYLDKYNEKTSS